ncbi:MAG: hypothetical protein HY691_00450, partial [Chloroflexi bacterium]|nr:hypothetical protein [Chloroflexota bacterium]
DTFVGSLLVQAIGESAYHTYETTLPPVVTLGVLAVHFVLRRLRAAGRAPEHAPQEVEVH